MRDFSPRAIHPGNMGYAKPPPSVSSEIPPFHQRPAGLGELGIHTTSHHRVSTVKARLKGAYRVHYIHRRSLLVKIVTLDELVSDDYEEDIGSAWTGSAVHMDEVHSSSHPCFTFLLVHVLGVAGVQQSQCDTETNLAARQAHIPPLQD
ncbi:Nuclear protein involved in pre-rRNA processing [Penicillium atrosanguineum]|uniref:Nuclear protein involved in pre-rRNA processing n=1 Tax=Penicillium atrosanguineum TaxID=1132637 RepID=UPI0023849F43|nr:Nuclear protein involved in pre-rRNA processing [Penicillium atrosanguineum]KAJ5289865.1 Nuclear protein involved in pre-rRNA processing [Penicillium atrosanguineum]